MDRRLFRRLFNGEVINPQWTRFSFPTWWQYDVLRGLDYLQKRGADPDERIDEAIGMVQQNRMEDGRWLRQNFHGGAVHFDIDGAEGEASRWNTLRALRVLKWADRDFIVAVLAVVIVASIAVWPPEAISSM